MALMKASVISLPLSYNMNHEAKCEIAKRDGALVHSATIFITKPFTLLDHQGRKPHPAGNETRGD